MGKKYEKVKEKATVKVGSLEAEVPLFVAKENGRLKVFGTGSVVAQDKRFKINIFISEIKESKAESKAVKKEVKSLGW